MAVFAELKTGSTVMEAGRGSKKMEKTKTRGQEVGFEEALGKLEEIVARMESDEITLEEGIEKFEEGIKFSKLCHQKLNKAAGKIELLLKDAAENVTLVEYDFKADRRES